MGVAVILLFSIEQPPGKRCSRPTFPTAYAYLDAQGLSPACLAHFQNASGSIQLINTIVADNPLGSDCFNNAGSIADLGRNLDSDGTCGLTPPSIPVGSANLAPLQNNGGATRTHALLSGSEAIDAGDNGLCPALDQRGVNRPADGGGNGAAVCDIGSFELVLEQAFAPMIISSDS